MSNKAIFVKRFPTYQVLDDKQYRESNLKLVHSSRTRLSGLGNFYLKKLSEEPQVNSPKDPQLKAAFPSDKVLWNLDEIMNAPIEGVYFIIGELIQGEAINLLTGSSDVGKTMLYLDMCLAIVQGKLMLFGEKLTTRYNGTLIVSTEDSIRSIKGRILKKLKGKKLPVDILEKFLVLTSNSNIPEQVREVLMKTPCDLIVIDAFGDAYQGNMNSSNDVRNYMDGYENLIREFGCTVLFIHHNVKNSSHKGPHKDKTLGSEGIVSRARQVIEMTKISKDPSTRFLTITKGNENSDDVKNIPLKYLRFDSKSLTFEALENKEVEKLKAVKSNEESLHTIVPKSKPGRKKPFDLVCKAWELRDKEWTMEAIAKEVGKTKSTISNWLKEPRPICNEDQLYKEALK